MKNNRILPTTLLSAAMAALFSITTLGCDSTSQDPAASNTNASDGNVAEEGHEGHEGHEDGHQDHDGASANTKDIKAALAKLSPEDAASAEKQKICPVSEQPLGSMGAPKKVDVKGRQVWICCDHCKDALLGDPEKHLAKLKE